MIDQEARDASTMLPEHIRSAALAYVEDRRMPGDFLCAVIDNDLMAACGRADPLCLTMLGDIAQWFYNFTPSTCHGSKEKRLAWVERSEGKPP